MSKITSSLMFLPVAGPAASFLIFPQEDPDSLLKDLEGNVRQFAEAELAIARCDFVTGWALAEKLLNEDRYFLAAVRMGVISAIGLGDLQFFDSILRRLEDFRKKPLQREMELGAVVTEAWLRQWLWLPTGYPEWMFRFDMTDVPEPWRQLIAYLGMKIRIAQGAFESAYAAASLFLNFICPPKGLTAGCAYAKVSCAVACRETGRKDEMMRWLGEVVRTHALHGMLLPFLMFMHGSHRSPVEDILREVAPEQVSRYRTLSAGYFKNLIRVRNHFTGERVIEGLSFREFYLAMLLKRKLSYKELAERFGISVGRMRNLVAILYQKINIHGRAELKHVIW